MKVRSSLEIDQMKKYSAELSASSVSSVQEAKMALDSTQHLLSRVPVEKRDMKDALKFARQAVYALKSALRNSSRSERMQKKALRSEKVAKKAMLREEKKQIQDMKKAEPAELKETVVIPEPVNDEAVVDMVPVENDD